MFLHFFDIVNKLLDLPLLQAFRVTGSVFSTDNATLCLRKQFLPFFKHSPLMDSPRFLPKGFLPSCALVCLACLPAGLAAKDKKDAVQYGMGLMVNVPNAEAEVVKAVEEVVQNGVVRGTKEYNKDEFLTGATVATESSLFPAWTEGGKVFYKVRYHALDPRNFKDTNDVGTVAVRYVVMGQDEKHTVLRIDALFVEDFKHRVHQSDGSVEGAEYKDIHDHIDAIELVKQQTAEAERQKQEAAERKFDSESATAVPVSTPAPTPETAEPTPTSVTTASSIEDLELRVRDLRRQTERKVKAPGAPLKAAPFHTASNLKSLNAGTEVLVMISTPYWYGVETHDGDHGWIMRDELEEIQ